MVDKIPNSANMIFQLFREREGFTNKARHSLSYRAIETLNVIGFALLLPDRPMPLCRKNRSVGFSKIETALEALTGRKRSGSVASEPVQMMIEL